MIKNKCTQLLSGLLLLCTLNSYAGNQNYWTHFQSKAAPSILSMAVPPQDYAVFTLDQTSMKQFLGSLSDRSEEGQYIMLPDPGNRLRRFKVWSTSVMEPALAAKYPEIRTFTAVAEDDPSVMAKLDYTEYGFRAMVYNGAETYLIDPYSNTGDGYYMAFYKKDYLTAFHAGNSVADPQTGDLPGQGSPLEITGGGTAARTNGDLRRVYRLAISCTGEYAHAVAGAGASKSQVMAKIVSTVNRVNGVYESELSVSLTMIANNDIVVYNNPATDPYECNTNLICLIDEVEASLTTVLGNQNYDIGHVLCTAGGGMSDLGVVCGADGVKARGVSTSGGPEDIDNLLHEIGRQFGANRTFNAATGNCNENGNEGTAYEPGAGTTIMSYAGLCNPNNVGPKGHYFHVASLREITVFLKDKGATCGSVNAGTNPISLPNVADSFTIPKNTPFELEAPVATPLQASAKVTYCWEQYDLGNFEGAEASAGNATKGPILKSYLPDTNRVRSYPSLARILDGSYAAPGERLPLVGRVVNFKLTARSLYQGWGTFNSMDSLVKITVAGSGPFRVTSQTSKPVWNPGEQQTITWSVGGSDQAPINCKYVSIFLSYDDGKTFPDQLVSNALNNGSYTITVPSMILATKQGRIKIKGSGNIFFDINKAAITINGNLTGIKEAPFFESLNVFPNPATDHIHIQHTDGNLYDASLNVVLYNAIGQKVWQGTLTGSQLSIPTGSWSRGNYWIHLINEKEGTKATRQVVLR